MKWYCMKDENTYIFSPVPLYSFHDSVWHSSFALLLDFATLPLYRDGNKLSVVWQIPFD